MIKVVIIEDELNNRELLQQMLLEYCEGVVVEGFADDIVSGIALIKEIKPDVVFLDVEMPGGTGFDILKAFDAPAFKVVFVTGYDHYAIKAIKYSALDYLLKPINLKELRAAVEKAKMAIPSYAQKIDFLKKEVEHIEEGLDKIVISNNKSHLVIPFDEILFVEAERTYATFHLEDNKKQIASNPLNFYEDLLPDTSFFRIHKSYIINCRKIEKLEGGRGGHIHLVGGITLPIAFRRKPTFIRFFKNMKQ